MPPVSVSRIPSLPVQLKHKLTVPKKTHRIGRRQEKSRAAWEGGYRQTRLDNDIVTLCNALINL
jgi:hypothetical protein